MNVTSTMQDSARMILNGDNEDITLLESERVFLTNVSEPSLSHEDLVDIGVSDLLAMHCSEGVHSFGDSLIGEAGSGDGKIRLALQHALFLQSQN